MNTYCYNGIFEQLSGPNESKFSYRVKISSRFNIEKIIHLDNCLSDYIISFTYYPPNKYTDYWLIYFHLSDLTKHKQDVEYIIYYILQEIFN